MLPACWIPPPIFRHASRTSRWYTRSSCRVVCCASLVSQCSLIIFASRLHRFFFRLHSHHHTLPSIRFLFFSLCAPLVKSKISSWRWHDPSICEDFCWSSFLLSSLTFPRPYQWEPILFSKTSPLGSDSMEGSSPYVACLPLVTKQSIPDWRFVNSKRTRISGTYSC